MKRDEKTAERKKESAMSTEAYLNIEPIAAAARRSTTDRRAHQAIGLVTRYTRAPQIRLSPMEAQFQWNKKARIP